jgi:hypothetical protein
VVDFTAITVADPAQVMQYTSATSPRCRTITPSGTVDKFIGDAIMAI